MLNYCHYLIANVKVARGARYNLAKENNLRECFNGTVSHCPQALQEDKKCIPICINETKVSGN